MGCRTVRAQQELIRVVRRPDGDLVAGRTEPGRGAWLCAGSVECVDLAGKRRAFDRALKGAVNGAAIERLRAWTAESARMVRRD